MTPRTIRRALATALALATIPALLPAAAQASTWTVDDDRQECPGARYGSIQAAVDQAAPWDTLIVCPGLYEEQSTPFTHANSPAQAGSRNGLTITKPLTIKGAGADKVTIRPSPALGSTLAGTAPYLRDGGGNVVTISRQSLGSSDDNENFVDISGVTIESPDAYAEAGVAFFNTSGRIARSVVGPLRRAAPDTELASRPHGWGVIMTNSLQGAEAGVRREVTIEDSLVTGYQAGGVLFDDATGTDGAASNAVRSGVKAYGYVTRSRIAGGGRGSAVPQTGIRFHAGQRGAVVDSDIVGNSGPDASAATARASVGLLLTDAFIGDDPANPGTPAFSSSGNTFSGNGYGVFNADIANAAVRVGAPAAALGSSWGCPAGPVTGASNATSGCQGISGASGSPAAASVDVGSPLSVPASHPAVPAPTPDAAPSTRFLDPIDGLEVPVGGELQPVVEAADDFGVRAVALLADGAPVASTAKAPYEFRWSPTAAQAGRPVTLEARVTDSAGQTTTTSVRVVVPGTAPGPDTTPTGPLHPPVRTVRASLTGAATVGRRITCLPGTWTGSPTSYGFAWLRDGKPVAGAIGSTYLLRRGDTASSIACRVTARNGDGVSRPSTSSAVTVRFPQSRTAKRTITQVGPALVTLSRTVKVGASGRATLGSASCVRAAASRCTVTVRVSARVGGRSATVSRTIRVSRGRSGALSVALPASTRSALRRGAGGKLTIRAGVRDDAGLSASRTASVALRRG